MKKAALHFGFVFPEELKFLKPERDGIVRILLSKDGSFEVQYRDILPDVTDRICISQHRTDKNEFLFFKTTYQALGMRAVLKKSGMVKYMMKYFSILTGNLQRVPELILL